MTNPTPAGSAPVQVSPTTFDYVGGTPELDQLLAMEDDLYTKAKAIEEQLKEVKDRIKIALTSRTRPGSSTPFDRYRIGIPGAVARVLRGKVSRRVNTPVLKSRYPEIYDECSTSGGAWYLEREK